jgi:hypothetical protein
MGADQVFKVVGEVAGIGGLVVGLFFLVVRLVVHKVPAPLRKNVPEKEFFQILNRIILYAFILALVGLLIYALLQINARAASANEKASDLTVTLRLLQQQHNDLTAKYVLLQSDDDNLRSRIEQIEEAGLKARSSGIEVRSTDITYDLRGWKAVPDQDRATKKRSELVWTTKRQVIRAQKEATQFAATFATSSPFDPDFSCLTQNMKHDLNTDPLPQGKESLRRWILTYDISNEPLFTPFDIVTEIRAWNSMQNPVREHEGTLIMFPTRRASLEVVFPPGKPPKPHSIECSGYALAMDKSPEPFKTPDLIYSEDGLRVKWNIGDPMLGWHYIIQWDW